MHLAAVSLSILTPVQYRIFSSRRRGSHNSSRLRWLPVWPGVTDGDRDERLYAISYDGSGDRKGASPESGSLYTPVFSYLCSAFPGCRLLDSRARGPILCRQFRLANWLLFKLLGIMEGDVWIGNRVLDLEFQGLKRVVGHRSHGRVT